VKGKLRGMELPNETRIFVLIVYLTKAKCSESPPASLVLPFVLHRGYGKAACDESGEISVLNNIRLKGGPQSTLRYHFSGLCHMHKFFIILVE